MLTVLFTVSRYGRPNGASGNMMQGPGCHLLRRSLWEDVVMNRLVQSLVLPLLLMGQVLAEDPVHFESATLKAAVEDALWISDPTPTDMLGLTELTHIGTRPRYNPIESLAGLEHALNLQSLTLRCHLIISVSPLSGLVNLRTLILQDNEIADISPLAGLTSLWTLNLERNEVTDVSALSGMTELSTLSLHRNNVIDISPLTNLTSLRWFDLRINPLNMAAYDTYIGQILANNPGIWFVYDPSYHRRIVIDVTIGGTVTHPGVGAFSYDYGYELLLVAKPDPYFVFAGWSGTYSTASSLIFLRVDQDYYLQANFHSVLSAIYVDDDAVDDPGPTDPRKSDPQENGTSAHPFDTIQEAIGVAADGASIIARAGVYRENIRLLGKSIQLTGADPNDSSPGDYPVIEGSDVGPVVTFMDNEDPNCRLTGFVITRGTGRLAGALYCAGASPTITNCLIVGNRATDPDGAAVYCRESRAVLRNCTIADNHAGAQGAALTLVDSDIVMLNSIVWGNSPHEIRALGTSHPSLRFCNVRGSGSDLDAMDSDPLFTRRGCWTDPVNPSVVLAPENERAVWMGGDYHLKSQAGRWDPDTGTWVQDSTTSPCIDRGDPTSPIGDEPAPHGGRINMGVYGGTPEASKSTAGP